MATDLTEAQRQAAREIMDRWPQWFGPKGMRSNEQLRFMLDLAQVLAASPAERTLASLRADGWAVAIHNDYNQNGKSFTFWLLTKGNRCVRGEALTDAEALAGIAAAVRRGDA